MSTPSDLVGAFKREIDAASSILIGTHLNPDGDALGCALAMSLYLDKIGKPNEVLCHHAAPKNLLFLPGVGRIRKVPRQEKHDLAIVLDLDPMERLGDPEPYFNACPRMIVVDHHVPHQAPGDLRIIDTSAPATAVILTRLLTSLGAEITPDMATCLLTGIVTDTGSFRFRNTTPEALSLSAYLLEHGADLNTVSEEIFQSKPLSSTRLLGRALETMQLDCHNQIAWSALSKEDFEIAEATDEDTEGFVNELLFIDTVKIAAVLREVKLNKVRCSVRSRADLDVAEVARHFGGGGHKNAAGCTFDTSLEEAEELLVKRIKLCLASC